LTVRQLVVQFEGCSGGTAGELADGFTGRRCDSLRRKETEELLRRMRERSRLVKPNRLGALADPTGYPTARVLVSGTFKVKPSRGVFAAEVPYVVEAWAEPSTESSVILTVNRTPSTAELIAYHEKTELGLVGCGLNCLVAVGRAQVNLRLNVETPYMPITTDGKAPNLLPMFDSIEEAIKKVVRKVRRIGVGGSGKADSQKARIGQYIDTAVTQASGDHKHSFSQRQLYYVVRAGIGGENELQYPNFEKVIGDYENANGPIPGMYRDPRGVLYHPHLHEEIPLGTRAVETYARPPWTFNKILYCEKEGFVSILREAGWPERNDCALMTAKGFANRSARDILDLLGETDEQLLFFAVHDADASGTLIYQALQEATAARAARNVQIVNLGLDPWEACEMELSVESVVRKSKRRSAVAEYVLQREDGKQWADWLQDKRVELNAMTTPAFIAWLDRKMEEYGQGRLVPPAQIIGDRLQRQVHAQVEQAVRTTILAENNFPGRVENAVRPWGHGSCKSGVASRKASGASCIWCHSSHGQMLWTPQRWT